MSSHVLCVSVGDRAGFNLRGVGRISQSGMGVLGMQQRDGSALQPTAPRHPRMHRSILPIAAWVLPLASLLSAQDGGSQRAERAAPRDGVVTRVHPVLPIGISVFSTGKLAEGDSPALRVEVAGVSQTSLLVVGIEADAGGVSAELVPSAGLEDIKGVPFMRRVEPPGGRWEIRLPQALLDMIAQASEDGRVPGWAAMAYVVSGVSVRPINEDGSRGRSRPILPGDCGLEWTVVVPADGPAAGGETLDGFAQLAIRGAPGGVSVAVRSADLLGRARFTCDADPRQRRSKAGD